MTDQVTIGTALQARRETLGVDQQTAAHRIGMSRTTYGSYELNRQRPSVEVLPALATFLDVTMDELFDLYGATCATLARATLERMRNGATVARTSPSVTSSIFADTTAEGATSVKPTKTRRKDSKDDPAIHSHRADAKKKKKKGGKKR